MWCYRYPFRIVSYEARAFRNTVVLSSLHTHDHKPHQYQVLRQMIFGDVSIIVELILAQAEIAVMSSRSQADDFVVES